MSAVLDNPALAPVSAAEAMLDDVREIADGALAELADDIDRRGIYPEGVLKRLGAAGAFRANLALDGSEPDYGAAIRAITAVSRVCGATGFMMWCHDVCGLYMEASGNPALGGRALYAHAAGDTLGATGMSNPMKTFAGIETLLLRARPAPGGYVVDGTLPWVSNLGPDHYFGAVAVVEGDAPGAAPREIMFIVRCGAPGVELRECPSFSAMEGTNTWAVRLIGHAVGAADLVADPVRPFIGRIRAAFVLLQCGMGLGVAQGAIDSMWTVERQLGHVNEYLDDRPDALQSELDALTERTLLLARTPFERRRFSDRRARCPRPCLRAGAAGRAICLAAPGRARLPDELAGAAPGARVALCRDRHAGDQASAQGDRAAQRTGDAGMSHPVSTRRCLTQRSSPPGRLQCECSRPAGPRAAHRLLR